MATRYEAGRRAEWRLKRTLEAGGWTVIRAAGSKGPYDLVVFPRSGDYLSRIVAVQVKTTRSPKAAEALLRAFEPVVTATYETQLWVWCKGQWANRGVDKA